MDSRQRKMVGHGAIVMIFGLVAGFGLVISLIGGFELVPGSILEIDLPGNDRAWARAHAGGLMNGLMILVGALLLWAMKIPDRTAWHLSWMLVGAGYANLVFYLGGIFAANRALTFGDNRFGESDMAAVIGLLPALVFAIVTIIAMIILAVEAFRR